ncbi:MAG: cysteine hydrolase family protein [Syntrophobacteraceae bacterium]
MAKALLIIDIQNDYFPGGKMVLEGSPEAGERAGMLLDAARRGGLPVFHVQHVSVRPDASFFLPETIGVEINGSVRPLPGEDVIQKHFPNSFRETPLFDRLKARDVAELIIAGMMTHMCIDATTRAAFDLGFRCTLAHDACASRALTFEGSTVPARQVHAAFVAALSGIYAEARPVVEVIRGL